jgi:Mrp family chromosome partitioning ATPase
VILVDLDLRKPNLHNVFGIAREPGFTNLALGREADLLAAAKPQLRAIATRLNGAVNSRVATLDSEGVPVSMVGAQRLLREAEGAPELAVLVEDARRQIAHADDLLAFLRPTAVPNLLLLTAGTIPPHPSELLGSPRAAELMERLHAHADMVIFDSPPAGIVTDAVIVAPRVDAILHVVRAGYTRIDLIRRCKAMLEQAAGPGKILGPVLNQVRLRDMGSYSYYYYYGYGEKQ